MSEIRSDTVDLQAERPRGDVTGPMPEQGARIGRYVIEGELGAGTMGVVFAAYDPELDRKVAIKLLKARSDDQTAPRARLQREAQALAKLAHRNVVGVYDVGVHEDQLFLAMEYVPGKTLRAWMESDPPPTWPTILSVVVDAARGLAAAHGAGLVHRDFKPDNVMIHEDGGVRVMDFGLARPEMHTRHHQAHDSATNLEILTEIQATVGHLTQTGRVMGTPGYMARELFDAQPADARSDQFALCVTLYEALYGERPFPGRTMAQLVRAVVEGRVRAPPRDTKVPRWLRQVIVRGLSPDPEQRWPSVEAMLEALAEGPRRQRRRLVALAGLLGLLGAAGWLAVDRVQDARMCEAVDRELVEVWNDERRAKLAASFSASGLGYSADAWSRVERGLDDYATRWLIARTSVCEARRDAAQDSALLELREACLGERLLHLRATISVLARADTTTVDRAAQMVAELPRIEHCDDAEALRIGADSHEAPTGSAREAELERALAEAEALEKAARYKQGLELSAEVAAAATEMKHERLLARARLREGILQRRAGDYEAAVSALEQAYELAEGLRMSAEAAEAAAQLVFVIGYQLQRHEQGRRWAVHAKPLARAAGTPEAQALYLNNIGAVDYAEGHFADARAHWQQALEIREGSLGLTHPSVAGSLNNLGVVALDEGNYGEARAYHERALSIWAEAMGPEHPQTSYSLNHLGRVAVEQGRYDDARSFYERALAIREQALGPDHSLVADTLANLGQWAERAGEHDEQALAWYERALSIYEAALGSKHTDVAEALTGRGRVRRALGQIVEARADLERALSILSDAEGDPTRLARTRFALAQALAEGPSPERQRARSLADQARDVFEAAGDKSARELEAVEAWLAGRR